MLLKKLIFFIPVTRRVKGCTRIVGKYVTGRRICFVRLSVRMNAEISETIQAKMLGLGM